MSVTRRATLAERRADLAQFDAALAAARRDREVARADAAHARESADQLAAEIAARQGELDTLQATGDDEHADRAGAAVEMRTRIAYLQQRERHAREHTDHARKRVADCDAQVAALAADADAARARLDALLATFEPADRSGTPLRELTLEALDELGMPATSAVMADYLRARFGRDVPTSRFGTLRRDEEDAYERARVSGRDRPVWLVPGLDRHGNADRSTWTRSNWDLARRCTAGDATRRLFERLLQLASDPPADTADPDGLWALISDHAHIHGVTQLHPWDTAEPVPVPAEPDGLAEALASAERDRVLFGLDHTLDIVPF